jgi:hypothetical protein
VTGGGAAEQCGNHARDDLGEAERPFFGLAQAIVANTAFIPKPGVTCADAMTLDRVMGYAAT